MLVSRIMPYSGIASNSKNRTNVTNGVTFQARTPERLPEDFVELANKVVAKYKELYKPVSDANWIIGVTKISKEEKERAYRIIKEGVTFDAPVVIAGKKQTCKAHVEQYWGSELCLDVGEGAEARRYRIKLDSTNNDKVKNSSELRVQKKVEEYKIFAGDFLPIPHDEKVSTMRTLLEAFQK